MIDVYVEDLIVPNFDGLLASVLDHEYSYYILKGGRGSTKSTFISLAIVLLLTMPGNEKMHGICFRKTANTLRDSVFSQMQFAIDKLELNDDFVCRVSPMKITRKSTGQTILFRGVDDKTKIKSLKAPFGYFAFTWFEEADAFASLKEIRSVLQSTMRGGHAYWTFMSFNPPETWANFMNEAVRPEKLSPGWVVHTSDYRAVPREWLGDQFFDDAEHLKLTSPKAYAHEYLGEIIGSNSEVFDNLRLEEISDDRIKIFDRIYMGIDWGWYPDPFHWSKMHYDAARHTLYIYDEYRVRKQSNRDTWDALRVLKGVTSTDLITADSAEPKSVSDYREYGSLCRGAEKGPDSVRYGVKWLQSLASIVIDPRRCPDTATEFQHYEYDRTPEGEVISGYPDANNHAIDSVRYALERVWKRKGQ